MPSFGQALSALARILRSLFLLFLAYPIPLLLLLPTVVLASVASKLSTILSLSTWRNLASATIVLGYIYFAVWIIVSTIFTPILLLLKDTQTYWIIRNIWLPRHLSTTLNIIAGVAAILGACALAYMSSELAPDMVLFIAAVWASVLSVLVHQKDIDSLGEYLGGSKPWSSPWRFRAEWRRPLLLLPAVSVGFVGTLHLLDGPARSELDVWFLVLAAWFWLCRYVITSDDWKEVRKVIGRWWRTIWVTAIVAAVFGTGVALLLEEYKQVAERYNQVIS